MIVKLKDIPKTDKENVWGGTGRLSSQMAVTPETRIAGSHFKAAGRVALDVGTRIGLHKHSGDEELYVILSGEGLYSEDEKQETVTAGDMLFLADGHSHGLQNTGKEPLVFIGIVAD